MGIFELTCACNGALGSLGGRHGRSDGDSGSESLAIGVMLALYYRYYVTYGVKWKGSKNM